MEIQITFIFKLSKTVFALNINFNILSTITATLNRFGYIYTLTSYFMYYYDNCFNIVQSVFINVNLIYQFYKYLVFWQIRCFDFHLGK